MLGCITLVHTAASMMARCCGCAATREPLPLPVASCASENMTVLMATSKLRQRPRYTVPKPPRPICSSSTSVLSSPGSVDAILATSRSGSNILRRLDAASAGAASASTPLSAAADAAAADPAAFAAVAPPAASVAVPLISEASPRCGAPSRLPSACSCGSCRAAAASVCAAWRASSPPLRRGTASLLRLDHGSAPPPPPLPPLPPTPSPTPTRGLPTHTAFQYSSTAALSMPSGKPRGSCACSTCMGVGASTRSAPSGLQQSLPPVSATDTDGAAA
mmetsp:Transcript_14017/g.40648  ORF Transcript_14017/g.40648 Transcript_14017/m.40648 type:complete len:276 (+) Transcript_14017:1815-2642(+)